MGATREIRILIVEDHPDHAAVMRKRLEASNRAYRVEVAPTGRDGLEVLKKRRFAVILLDYSLPDGTGLKFLDQLNRIDPEVPILFVTAQDSLDIAVEAMKRGASDYLVKNCDYVKMLPLRVRSALERVALRRERARLATTLAATEQKVKQLTTELLARYSLDNLVAQSGRMRAALECVAQAIESDAPVLITGETGTGKELVAGIIHFSQMHRTGIYTILNCAAIPEGLWESELFGYVRGAFTGATENKPGFLDKAQGGTLFLDEVGEMPPALQVKLLRMLQEKTFCPLGTTRERLLDVRFIAATNKDLSEAIERGFFRKDLYYRLAGISIDLPPLRQRREDIVPLARKFLEKAAEKKGGAPPSLDSTACALLRKHPWRGNVRELEHLMRRAASVAKGARITARTLRTLLRAPRPSEREEERRHIVTALERNRWKREPTAVELGISLATLWRRMKDLEIGL